MRPRCVELARVLKKTGSFYYHCDWHTSHYVKVMLDGDVRSSLVCHPSRLRFGGAGDLLFLRAASMPMMNNRRSVPKLALPCSAVASYL
jgi:hypothetical protein